MARKLGYQLFSIRRPDEADIRLFMGGLFKWVDAFERNGRFGRMGANVQRAELEDCDIIGVNYTPSNASYVAALREELGEHSDTKIAANVDFGTIMWNRMDPLVMKKMLNMADIVFHVESSGARKLQKLLEREVHVIPHPVAVEDIKQMKLSRAERADTITCQYHRYADTWAEYYYGLMEIRKYYYINAVLMNYEAPPGDKGPKVPVIALFNTLYQKMVYKEYLKLLAHALINIDVTHDSTYGRGVVEAAALGVPTVCSDSIEAGAIWGRKLSIRPDDEVEMRDAVKRLLDNEQHWQEMSEIGYEKADYYSLQSSYNRMKGAYESL